MNYLSIKAQHETEERQLERKGWKLILGIPQEHIASSASNGKYPQGTKYHWTSQTLLVPPVKE